MRVDERAKDPLEVLVGDFDGSKIRPEDCSRGSSRPSPLRCCVLLAGENSAEISNVIAGGPVVDGNLMLEVLRYSNFTGHMGIATMLPLFWGELAFWDCRPVHGCSDKSSMFAAAQHRRLGMPNPTWPRQKQVLFRYRGSNQDETMLRSESLVLCDDRFASEFSSPKPPA